MSGQGSIYRRADGRWVAQLSSGPRTHRRYRRRVRPTRGEAIDALEQLAVDRRAGVAPSRLSLGEYLQRWLDETARPSVSANTLRGYADAIAHFDPIADVPLRELTAEDIEAVCNRMVSRRGNGIQPASAKTVRNAQLMLRRALSIAEQRGHVARNVARQVPLRRVPQAEADVLTAPRARAILAAVAGDRYEAAFALAMVGLRASEILGLAWDDVDLDAATVRVRYQLVGSGRGAARAQLKTRASRATMPLPSFVISRLRSHLERQRQERPIAPIDGGLVFVTAAGLAVNGSWLTKHFQALLAAAGLPRMRLHDLRHGAATLLVGAGVHPRVAQQLLRHANSRTTMEIYAHVSGAQQREAAGVLDAVLSESPGESRHDRAVSAKEVPHGLD